MDKIKNFLTPHDGKLLNHKDNESIIKSLKMFLIMNPSVDTTVNFIIDSETIPYFVIGREGEEEIEAFMLPIFFEEAGKKYCAIDVRQVCKYKAGATSIFELTKQPEILQTDVNLLTLAIMYNEKPHEFDGITKSTAAAMSTWISRLLGSSLTLSMIEIIEVEIIVSYYFNYIALVKTDAEKDNHEIAAFRVGEQLGHQHQTYTKKVISDMEELPTDIHKLFEILKTTSPKLKNLDMNTLVTLMSRSVVLSKGVFLILSSLEYMPTMLTVIMSALTTRINTKSILKRSIEKSKATIFLVESVNVKLSTVVTGQV